MRAAAVALATALPGIVLIAPRAAVADPLASARAEAAQVNAQLQADGARLDILSNQYDAAEQRVAQLQQQQAAVQQQIAEAQSQIGADRNTLHDQALAAYVDGAQAGDLAPWLASNGDKAAETQEYRSVATGDLSDAVDQLHIDEANLASEQQQLQQTESQAEAAAQQVAATQKAAEAEQATEKALLSKLNGQIASLVAQQQAAQEAAQQAAIAARLAAQTSVHLSAVASSGGSSHFVPSAAGAAGAVQAAESQLGDPYVYGGSAPRAFDCSGLTMWSWAQVGVYLPRTAAEQYDAITHIPLSDLQPGDLVFWDDGTGSIQHVGMYVGNGDVIHAPSTGSVVRIQPIWTNGLVGAGRP